MRACGMGLGIRPTQEEALRDYGKPNSEVGWRTRLERLNNRFGPRAIGRPIENLVRRAQGEPTTRVNDVGDEEPDPASSVEYHKSAQRHFEDSVAQLRQAGMHKLADVHEKLAKAHGSAAEYHRDRLGRFASFSHRALSARPPLALDGTTVEFVANRGQGQKLLRDLREFGHSVRVVSAQPIGPSGGRLHVTVEVDDPETARFLKQWAAQYNAVERPSWAKPGGVRPKAVRRGASMAAEGSESEKRAMYHRGQAVRHGGGAGYHEHMALFHHHMADHHEARGDRGSAARHRSRAVKHEAAAGHPRREMSLSHRPLRLSRARAYALSQAAGTDDESAAGAGSYGAEQADLGSMSDDEVAALLARVKKEGLLAVPGTSAGPFDVPAVRVFGPSEVVKAFLALCCAEG